jgi:hypothetical protein
MPLVIELLDFTATVTGNKDVLLNWKAYVDDEAKGFEIERSKDQSNWEKIGTVNLKTSNYTSDYSLLDQQPLQGRSYYRLKMVEKTGSSRYSKIRQVQIDQLITKLRIYPNPAKNDFTVSFNSSVNQPATLIIRSIAGEVVMRRAIPLTETDNRVNVSTNGLSNGLYVVELITSEKAFVNKLTVTH